MTLLGGTQLPKRGLGFELGQLASRALLGISPLFHSGLHSNRQK